RPRGSKSGRTTGRLRGGTRATPLRLRKRPAQLVASDLVPRTGFEVADLEPADAHALQAGHFVSDRLEHAADLAVASLRQLHGEMRLALGRFAQLDACGGQCRRTLGRHL